MGKLNLSTLDIPAIGEIYKKWFNLPYGLRGASDRSLAKQLKKHSFHHRDYEIIEPFLISLGYVHSGDKDCWEKTHGQAARELQDKRFRNTLERQKNTSKGL